MTVMSPQFAAVADRDSAVAASRSVLGLLAAGVPLTLLFDLMPGDGPDSSAIFAAEDADASWVPRLIPQMRRSA